MRIAHRLSRSFSDRASRFAMGRSLARGGVAHAQNISSWTTPGELRALYALGLSCSKEALALEIGSYLGASTCYIAAGLSQVGGHLYCVDTWQNETMPEGERDTFAEFNRNIYPLSDHITIVRKRSEDLNGSDIPNGLSLVFIDGDHSYQAVKQDFERILPFLAEDGVVAFHDVICYQGVSRVIGEALASGTWKVLGHFSNLLWIKRSQWEQ